MNSPRVSYPYKRFDICPRSSGAAAVVLTNLDIAKKKSAKPAFVTGVSAITHSVFMGDRMGVYSETEFSDHDGEHIAAYEAYRQAGITNPASQIQVAELYDPFSTFQFPIIEGAGLLRARPRAAAISDAGGWDMDGPGCDQPVGRHAMHQSHWRHRPGPGGRCRRPDQGQGRGRTRSRACITRSPRRPAVPPNSSPLRCWATTMPRQGEFNEHCNRRQRHPWRMACPL